VGSLGRRVKMKKLSKELLASKAAITAALNEHYEKLSDAIDSYNTEVDRLYGALAEALDVYNNGISEAFDLLLATPLEEYNQAVTDALQWGQDAADEIEDYMSDRSDKWRESDRGQAYEEWQNEFASFNPEEIEIDQPELVEVEEPEELTLEEENPADELDQLPEEL
jgi:hypothetical protein